MRPSAFRVALIPLMLVLALTVPAGTLQAQANHPEPRPVSMDPKTTALLILDLSFRCNPPEASCYRLAPVINEYLPKFDNANVFTIYTVSSAAFGPAELWEGFPPLGPNQTLTAPDSTDKLFTGELPALLEERGIKTLVITGASTNQAVLYTASSAARNFNYDVVIPLDGTNAARDYEYEYSIHQLTVVSFANKFRFTTLDMISFDEA